MFLFEKELPRMTKFLISFPAEAMNLSPAEMASATEESHAVIRAAKQAGVYVFAGGINADVPPMMVPPGEGLASEAGTRPRQLDGGFCVLELDSLEAAVQWAARMARACRCAQEVREFHFDPES